MIIPARVEYLTLEIHNLTGQTSQLQRNTQQMQTEIETLQSQLKSRDQELLETRSQLDIAHNRNTNDSDNRRQHKIDQLTAQVANCRGHWWKCPSYICCMSHNVLDFTSNDQCSFWSQ